MTKTKIDILLPFKESIALENQGAIATIIRSFLKASGTEQEFMVFGRPLSPMPTDIPYTPLNPKWRWLNGGSNLSFAKAYIAHLKTNTSPDAIEIHSRCQVAHKIATACPHLPVFLYLHNDPTQMKGAKTPAERQELFEKCAGIFCVSDYIRDRFCEGLSAGTDHAEKIVTIYNGVDRWLDAPVKKTKTIVIAGRMVPEKGILQACRVLVPLLKHHPEWHLHIIGGQHFAHTPPSAYEHKVMQSIEQAGVQATMHGFMEKTALQHFQQQAEIIIVPSLWPEPAGLTNLEALAVGAALITTDTGGAVEYSRGRAALIPVDKHTDYENYDYPEFSAALAKSCTELMSDTDRRRALQNTAWADYPFTAESMAQRAVNIRKNLINSFTSKVV